MRRRTKPFYLSLHYTAPHSPWEGPEDEAIGHTSHGAGPMVDGGSLKIYASMVKSMDAGIGRVLEALRRARLDRNTLVIFTSDNGGERFSYNWPFSFQKALPVGRRHSSPCDRPVARRDPCRPDQRSARHHHGLDRNDPGGDRHSARPGVPAGWRRRDAGLQGHAPALRADIILANAGSGRRHAWETGSTSTNPVNERLFDLSLDPGEKNDLRGSHDDMFKRVRAQYDTWNAQMLPRLTS